MLGRRQGRPSLIASAARTAGKTAVVVGTANAMSKPRGPAAAPAAAPMAQPVMDAAPAAGGLTDEAIGRLKQLSELHQAGILSEAEFTEQKARILNG
jgi:hypothetical protein